MRYDKARYYMLVVIKMSNSFVFTYVLSVKLTQFQKPLTDI